VASIAPRNLPLVVIAGKPNVGKSTLFNRLIGKRKAITDRSPGVTRDPVESETLLGERLVRLVDTGGVSGSREPLEEAVGARSVDLARRADVILLVVDVTDVTGEDERFLEKLRPLADRIVLVANKADTEARQQLSWDLHRLGLTRLVTVSAETGENVEELERTVCELLPPPDPEAEAGEPARPEIKMAIIGKPNTGKSTLLNRLLGEERSLVSAVPGTTRDSVEGVFEFGGHVFQAVDTAGIRRKTSVDTSVEYFSVNRAIKSVERADVSLLLIDSLESVSDQDKKIAAVVVARGHGIILCLNKWDTLKKAPNILTAMRDRVNFVFPVLHFAPILPMSAKTGFGVERVLETAVEIVRQLDLRVSSAPLNRALENWVERYPVPSGGKNLRIRFIAQTGVHPTTFVCHVNRKRAFPQTYLRYVENRIREQFGLAMIPMRIEVEDAHT
jgi:GTPase